MTDFHSVTNPNYSGNEFKPETCSLEDFDKDLGIKVHRAALKSSGKYQIVDFLFSKDKHPDIQECEKFVNDHKTEFRGMEMADREIAAFENTWIERSSGTEPTAEELAIINENYALEPLSSDQVYVREMLLTNDQWSTHNLRLSRGFQKTIIESTPGKSLLLGHPETKSTPAIPIGKFFSAFEYRDENGVVWNRAKFYIVKSEQNVHDRLQIDGGVWSHTSIGMETDWRQCSICGSDIYDSAVCKHVPGKMYEATETSASLGAEVAEAGKVYCGIIYRGKGTALEGSIVYFPELKGTKVLETWETYRKAYLSGDHGTAKEILLSGDDHQVSSGVEELAEPSSGIQSAEVIVMDNTVEEVVEEIVEEIVEEVTIENLEIFESVEEQSSEEGPSVEDLLSKVEELSSKIEEIQTETTSLKEDRVHELDRLSCLCNREAELKVLRSIFGEFLEKMSAENLIELENQWTKLVDDNAPIQRQSRSSEVVEGHKAVKINKSWI